MIPLQSVIVGANESRNKDVVKNILGYTKMLQFKNNQSVNVKNKRQCNKHHSYLGHCSLQQWCEPGKESIWEWAVCDHSWQIETEIHAQHWAWKCLQKMEAHIYIPQRQMHNICKFVCWSNTYYGLSHMST